METWTLSWTKLASFDTVSDMPVNIPGVYRLSYRGEDGNFYVFYVGQAEDIKAQLSKHKSESETNVCIKNFLYTKECFFRYAQISEDYVRKTITRKAYNYYQPSCNTEIPEEGKVDVDGNLDN